MNDNAESYFEIIPESYTVSDFSNSFRFVKKISDFEIVGLWTNDGKYLSRESFTKEMKELVKKLKKEHIE